MGKQDIEYALTDLETALSVIRENIVMPVSGNIYPWYNSAKGALERARKSMDGLHEHPYKPDLEAPEDIEPPTSCYCNATSHPPCGFCENQAAEV